MHKFTKVASGEREKQCSGHSSNILSEWCYEALKSNLQPEHKQMHKFIKVASEGREKQSSCNCSYILINTMKRWKVIYSLSISECTSLSKVASGEREIQNTCHSSYILSEW